MSKKSMIASVVAVAVVNTVSALPATDQTVADKQAQAEVMSNVIGNMTQTINSPECTVKPYNHIN